MNLKKIFVTVAAAAMVGFAALGPGAGVAAAKPHGPHIPWIPGPGHGHGGPNWGGGVNWVDIGDWIPPWWYFIPPPPPPPPPPGYPPYPGYPGYGGYPGYPTY